MRYEAEPHEAWDWPSGGFDEGTLAASSSPLCSPLLPLSPHPFKAWFPSVAHAGLALLPVLLRAGVTGWHRHGHLRFHSHYHSHCPSFCSHGRAKNSALVILLVICSNSVGWCLEAFESLFNQLSEALV